MRCDYHIHTYYSDDSSYPMEQVVQDAIALGLEEICFTDHVDYGIKIDHDQLENNSSHPILNVNYPAYFQEIARLKQQYQSQITIKQGLEFGIQSHTITTYQQLYDRYEFDFVILSIHQVNDQEFWNQNYQQDKNVVEYTLGYYREMLEVIRNYKDYSVLGHLDLIARYSKGSVPFEELQDLISQILQVVIADGKGIEINTSSARYGLDDLTPARAILKLYRDLGGKIITIGSDSHEKSHLGTALESTKDQLRQLGFNHYCTFTKMEPIFHKLKKD